MNIYWYVGALILFVISVTPLAHGNYPVFVIGGLLMFGISVYGWVHYYYRGPG